MIQTLFIILFLEGFISISVEILTIRQLIPFFGGSVIITSVIIGVFLLFLALGYWRGGRHQLDIFKQLSRNFSLALVWIGLGLSYSFVALFFYLTVFTLSLSFIASLAFYLLIILAPIVYWLGQTIPLTTNLFTQEQRVSRISGQALFISTLGSFLGALLTSLLLFQYVGVAWTIVINCFLLVLLVVYLKKYYAISILFFIFIATAFLFIIKINIQAETILFKKTNNYANYAVIQPDPGSKILQINQSNSSLLTARKEGFPYIEFIRDLLFKQINLKNKQILVIGAGGFTLSAAGTNGNKITYVDIDPDIKKIAEQYFLNEAIKGNFIGQDARQFLNQNQTKFDVIISDVYSNQMTIPPSLLTTEYFQKIAQNLKPNGLLIANIITSPFFTDNYAKRVANTILAIFPHCAIVPLNWQQNLVNVIYVCPNSIDDKTVYQDNLSSATFDFFRSKQYFYNQAKNP